MECARADQTPSGRADTAAVPAAVSVGAVIGVACLAAGTVVGGGGAGGGGLLAVDIAIGVASCALVPVTLRWPVPGALVLALLAALSPAATPAATAGTLVVAFRRRAVVAVGVGIAGVAGHAVRGLFRPIDALPYVWWLALVVIAHAALVFLGQLARARAELVASLRERALRAEAEQAERVAAARVQERTVIAREMHDVLAHRLSLLATYAGALEYRPDAAPEQLTRAAGVVRAGVHQALDELRTVIGVLRADRSEQEAGPDGGRPLPTLCDLPELIGESREAGAQVELDDRVPPSAALPEASGRTAYRIVQEALTNARRHAPQAPVTVSLEGGPGTELVIDIRNRLPDAPRHGARDGTGTGLIGLAERVRLAGGRLQHGSTPAGEFRLHAALPWPG